MNELWKSANNWRRQESSVLFFLTHGVESYRYLIDPCPFRNRVTLKGGARGAQFSRPVTLTYIYPKCVVYQPNNVLGPPIHIMWPIEGDRIRWCNPSRDGCVSRGQQRPSPRGRGPSAPNAYIYFTISPRATKFGMVFLRDQPLSQQKGLDPALHIFGIPYERPYRLIWNDQIRRSNPRREELCFTV